SLSSQDRSKRRRTRKSDRMRPCAPIAKSGLMAKSVRMVRAMAGRAMPCRVGDVDDDEPPRRAVVVVTVAAIARSRISMKVVTRILTVKAEGVGAIEGIAGTEGAVDRIGHM